MLLLQIGVLALPYALRMTGWFGLVLLATFGSAMTYTASIFGKNRDHFILESFSDHIEVTKCIIPEKHSDILLIPFLFFSSHKFSFSVPGRVTISFLFYVALLLNAGIYVKVLVTALSSLVSLSSSAALMIVSCLFVLIANTITSSTPLTLHVLGILGTLSTVLLLAALIGSECFALSSSPQAGQPPLPDEASESEIRVFWTDAVACFKTIGIFG